MPCPFPSGLRRPGGSPREAIFHSRHPDTTLTRLLADPTAAFAFSETAKRKINNQTAPTALPRLRKPALPSSHPPALPGYRSSQPSPPLPTSPGAPPAASPSPRPPPALSPLRRSPPRLPGPGRGHAAAAVRGRGSGGAGGREGGTGGGRCRACAWRSHARCGHGR